METAVFWIAWFLSCFWILKTYYFSYDKDKLVKLRLTSFSIDFSVLILFFLPWLSVSRGGLTGIELILRGDIFVIFLGILISCSLVAFMTKDTTVLKIGAMSHCIESVLFIATMIHLSPDTTRLTLQSLTPIFASLLLLIGNIVVLLLWQQVDLKVKKYKRK